MPNYFNPYQQNFQPTYPQQNYFQQQAQTQAQPQIQNGGFVSVHSEAEARNYPIAIGTSLTFKDENAPYVYTKTMGFSQLESPRFDKYRLVKEDAEQTQAAQTEPKQTQTENTAYKELEAKIRALEEEIEGIKKRLSVKTTTKKKGETEDDTE